MPVVPPQQAAPPRLVRSRDDRHVAGVCGGIAQHFGLEPWLVRAGAIILTVAGGSGIALYAAAWLLIPEDGEHDSLAAGLIADKGHHLRGEHRDRKHLLAIGLAVVALLGLANDDHFFAGIGLAVAVLVGLAVLGFFPIPGLGQREQAPSPAPAPQPRRNQAGVWAAVDDEDDHDVDDVDDVDDPEDADDDADLDPGDALLRDAERYRDEPYTDFSRIGPPPPPAAPPVARIIPRRRPGILFSVGLLTVVGLVAAIAGAALLAGAVEAAPGTFLALVLAGGVVVLVASRLGRAAGVLALAVVVILSFGGLAHGAAQRGGLGDRTVRPIAVAAIAPDYQLGIGELTIDLRNLDRQQLADAVTNGPVPVAAHVGSGHVLVLVPSDVRTVVDGHAGTGEVRIGDEWTNGVGADRHGVLGPASGPDALHLDLQIGFGQVEVRAA